MTREEGLRLELQRAYREIAKQVYGRGDHGAVFDREVCERAERFVQGESHDNSTDNWWGWNPHG